MASIVADRYLLPVIVLATYLGALGALTLAELVVAALRSLGRRRRGPAPGPAGEQRAQGRAGLIWPLVTAALALGLLLPVLRPHVQRASLLLAQLAHDHRESLQQWAVENIPADARVMQERYVAMEFWNVPFELTTKRSVAAEGTPRELAERGFTHVAISENRYDRFFDPALSPTPEYREEYERVRRNYEDLLNGRGVEKVYEYIAPDPRPYPINPSVHIYRLPPPAGDHGS